MEQYLGRTEDGSTTAWQDKFGGLILISEGRMWHAGLNENLPLSSEPLPSPSEIAKWPVMLVTSISPEESSAMSKRYEAVEDAAKGFLRGPFADWWARYWNELGERWAYHAVTAAFAMVLLRVVLWMVSL